MGTTGELPADLDVSGLSAPARAVLEARDGTCRYPRGAGPTFAFCGAPATVAAAGRLTYCEACAGIMYAPKVRPAGQTGPIRSAADRLRYGSLAATKKGSPKGAPIA